MTNDNDETIDAALLDSIGPWSELKHDMIAYYATVYSSILSHARNAGPPFHHLYIDGYASAGYNKRKKTQDIVKGSALRVLDVVPPFEKYVFIELDSKKLKALEKHCGSNSKVELIQGDANIVLPQQVFPQVRYDRYERAFCLLDPYNEAALKWDTICAAARAKTIDVLIHFPTYSMNINVLHKDGKISEEQAQRLNGFWGDGSWHEAAYSDSGILLPGLFDKTDNEAIVNAFCKRLENVAGFLGVSRPIPMKNRTNNTVYYLIFASSNETGVKVIRQVANLFLKVKQPYVLGSFNARATK